MPAKMADGSLHACNVMLGFTQCLCVGLREVKNAHYVNVDKAILSRCAGYGKTSHGGWTQKGRTPPGGSPGQSKVVGAQANQRFSLSTPGICQNNALHAAPADRPSTS